MEQGFDSSRNTFVQSYGSDKLDASLLMVPMVGFLAADNPKLKGTVAAIQEGLMDRGFVRRYRPDTSVDGLPEGEGVFLPCTFWLADNLAMQGRRDEAEALFNRLLDVRNDLGLIARNTTPTRTGSSAIFPRRSRTSAW